MEDNNRGYTIAAQITCIRRELAMRKNVYPKWVSSGRMKAEQADHEINCMQTVHDTLVKLEEEDRELRRHGWRLSAFSTRLME